MFDHSLDEKLYLKIIIICFRFELDVNKKFRKT